MEDMRSKTEQEFQVE
jgi:hypothetical protein